MTERKNLRRETLYIDKNRVRILVVTRWNIVTTFVTKVRVVRVVLLVISETKTRIMSLKRVKNEVHLRPKKEESYCSKSYKPGLHRYRRDFGEVHLSRYTVPL